jgi:3-deoxy-D-manno-octulosonate 8-phosphate phosphatase (KDO 8-P phosphatase)
LEKSIQTLFEQAGGTFCVPAVSISQKLQSIKAFVFDWDGVFNDGTKHNQQGSGFTEPDAMGTNMLRFSYWLKNRQLPITAIITGEENEAAHFLAKREHFTALYFKASNKIKSFEHFLNTHQLKAAEVAFVYDDVLDLAVAAKCGVRINAHRANNPMLTEYLKENYLVDYMTSQPGGQQAVREACELLISIHGNYGEAITHRMNFSETYQAYLAQRQQVEMKLFVGIS